MAKVPFKVSARTARLIGRENIASSKGAIIELVKNGYDADSEISLIYFDLKYLDVPNELTIDEMKTLLDILPSSLQFNDYYSLTNNIYVLNEDITDNKFSTLKKELYKLNSIYIIDNGEGMTQRVIIDHWMTIGTDNKANNIFTATGRVKAGAKGIGRFALDKLGDVCQMTTKFNPYTSTDYDINNEETKNSAYIWSVNWKDFEGDFKTIDNVEADLSGKEELNLKEYIINEITNPEVNKILKNYSFKHGTVLKISNLRDTWEDYYVQQVYDDLEVLVPPKEQSSFKLFLYSSQELDKYGELMGSLCDDYDYKVVATADKHQIVSIKIYRQEYDLETINPEFFKREIMAEHPFRKEDFEKGMWETQRTFSELVTGFSDVDKENIFRKIGSFEFTFYYMKRTYASDDLKKFHYRRFIAKDRQSWLNKFGGVKLFRDDFRVRPYGEINDSAFDWLGLGGRKAKSPAPTSHKSGKWKVEPDNVAGAINITRLGNIDFQDKSSREGLQENKTFKIFKNMILRILDIFEDDRATISRQMKLFHDEINFDQAQREYADRLAKEILEKARKKKESNSDNTNTDDTSTEEKDDSDKILLAEFLREKEEEIESLKDEQKLLRGMASSGIVIASFSHDLSKLSHNLNSRIDKLKTLIKDKIHETDYNESENRKNPFYFLERMKKQDHKIQSWLHFSLGVARKDKRRRKNLKFKSYFSIFKNDWKTILDARAVQLKLDISEEAIMRVFEIDMDSVFNNLLVNSIDAFTTSAVDSHREVNIIVKNNEKEVQIIYFDNGPGLSSDIVDKNKIFEPMFTTKVNQHTGDEEGTGLGMWLVKSIIEDNSGSIQLYYPSPSGFGIKISFPVKYKRG